MHCLGVVGYGGVIKRASHSPFVRYGVFSIRFVSCKPLNARCGHIQRGSLMPAQPWSSSASLPSPRGGAALMYNTTSQETKGSPSIDATQ